MTRFPFTLDPQESGAIGWDVGEYQLPPLPYPTDAFEGFLSAEVFEIHHGRHHKKYVDGLNRTLHEMAEARSQGDFERIGALARALAFHGSGHVLHTLYWSSMDPEGGKEPEGDLRQALETSFGSVEGFRKQFVNAALQVEADGWSLLSYEPLGRRLVVTAAESHQQMALQGSIPLFVCDVWEHAYYLAYQNKRDEYVNRFMDFVHWEFAAKRLAAVLGRD